MSLVVSSFMPTGNATVARARDNWTVPIPAIPQALTWYTKLIVRQVGSLNNPRVWFWGSGAGVQARISLFLNSANHFGLSYSNGYGTASPSVGTVLIAINDLIELRVTLSALGVVTLGVTQNGGLENTSAAAALVLPQAWNSTTMTLSAVVGGAQYGNWHFLDFLIARGVQSLATMQRWADTVKK